MIAVGAAIYLVRHAHGFWGVAWAVVRAIFWPVVVGYWMMSRLLPTAHVKPSPKGLEAPAAALRAPKAKSK